LIVVKQGKYIVTGTNDSELRVYHITDNANPTAPQAEIKEQLESDVGVSTESILLFPFPFPFP